MRGVTSGDDPAHRPGQTGDPRRMEFNSLHGYSVNALALAMIAAPRNVGGAFRKQQNGSFIVKDRNSGGHN